MPIDVAFLGLSTSTGGVDAGLFLLPRMGVLVRADSIYLLMGRVSLFSSASSEETEEILLRFFSKEVSEEWLEVSEEWSEVSEDSSASSRRGAEELEEKRSRSDGSWFSELLKTGNAQPLLISGQRGIPSHHKQTHVPTVQLHDLCLGKLRSRKSMDEDEIRDMVHNGSTYREISQLLQRRHPGDRGYSERTIRRFCCDRDIRYRSGLTERDLREVVGRAVREVWA